ncbi:MAG: hypothetical protein AB7D41_04580 [Arcobacter sp.]|uniref:hypothetical protein n=1 Tax=Arcobacter sp. TaxID=1872629 RepID=UPI003D01F146
MIDNRPIISKKEVIKEFEEYSSLLEEIEKQFKIDFYGDHGIYHWYSVYKNTQKLSKYYNIESKVFKLFSILHDSKRINEDYDLMHGKEASVYVKQLFDDLKINLNIEDLNRLIFACANHTKLDKSSYLANDLIVQICLDSDKLDLARVGIEPSSKYMLTSYSKTLIFT